MPAKTVKTTSASQKRPSPKKKTPSKPVRKKPAKKEEEPKEPLPALVSPPAAEAFAELLAHDYLPESLKEEFEDYCAKNRIEGKKKEALMERTHKEYKRSLVEFGEAVGIVAAQSLGEPGTQLTLRTKHYAGAVEVSVGSGIQRVEEIVDGRSKTKYPTMTIYLNEEMRHEEQQALEFGRSLIDVRGEDIAVMHEDFQNKKVTITLKEQEIRERNLDPEVLMAKMIEMVKTGKVTKGQHKFFIQFPKNTPLLKMRTELLKLLRKRVQGVSGIQKTILSKENDEFVLRTLGTNLKVILRKREVDITRTTTNDIAEIARVLGIEAGRHAVVAELHRTLEENAISVDIRHILLLADLITFFGEIRGTVRTGVMRGKSSPFARAAFEETVKHLLRAAFNGEREELQGVVENIIVGKPVNVGTGVVELVMKG